MHMMKNVTLKQLRILAVIARHRSFTRAADILNITQPAVSAQITQLEETLGLPLLDRLGHSVELTEAGQKVMACATLIERAIADADQSLTTLRAGKSGVLRIAAVDTAHYFAADLTNAFATAHPSVAIRYTTDKGPEVLRLLADNEVDLLIAGKMSENRLSVTAIPFADRPYVIIAPPDHPLARTRRLAPRTLFSHPFTLLGPETTSRRLTNDLALEHGYTCTALSEVDSNEKLKQVVANTGTMGCINRQTVYRELRSGALVELDIEGFPVVLRWHVFHLSNRKISPVARAFIDYLTEHGPALLHDGH